MATRDELYAKFGITAEAAQLFETEIGTLLLGVKGKDERWHTNPKPDEAGEFLAKVDKSTLGNLLRKLQKITESGEHIEIGDNLKVRFESALKVRNKLFHGFYERHNFKIQTHEGRSQMIDDLEIMHVELFNAWRLASSVSDIFLNVLTSEK